MRELASGKARETGEFLRPAVSKHLAATRLKTIGEGVIAVGAAVSFVPLADLVLEEDGVKRVPGPPQTLGSMDQPW